jgi:hypothetical protein
MTQHGRDSSQVGTLIFGTIKYFHGTPHHNWFGCGFWTFGFVKWCLDSLFRSFKLR